MYEISNLKEVYERLRKDAKKSLKEESVPVVKEVMKKHIEQDVYDMYRIDLATGEVTEPFVYVRRREKDGGLLSDKSILVELIENGVKISNIAKGKKDNFPLVELIEHGQGYNGYTYKYPFNKDGTTYQFLQPRPFIANTKEELAETGVHIDALKQGLKNKGWNVK